jgi:hypothetical protein
MASNAGFIPGNISALLGGGGGGGGGGLPELLLDPPQAEINRLRRKAMNRPPVRIVFKLLIVCSLSIA